MSESKQYYHNIDLVNNSIINAKLNPLSTTDRLNLLLTINDEGYVTYDKDLDNFFFWNGSLWKSLGEVFTEDFVVNIDPSKTYLKWRNGETVPATGKTPRQVLLEGALEAIHPSYVPPQGYITINQDGNYLEIGQTVNVNTIIHYLKNDAGDPPSYSIKKDGAIISNTSNFTDMNIVVTNVPKVYSATINYLNGVIKNNNVGQPDSFGQILLGQINTSDISLFGYRKCFFGFPETVPNSSSTVRGLGNSFLNPTNGTTFTITVPIGAKKIVFAYPNDLRDVTSVRYVELSNSEVKGNFVGSGATVGSANNYDFSLYKIFTYTPVEPFTQTVNYTITI